MAGKSKKSRTPTRVTVALIGGIAAVTAAAVPPLLGENRTETPVTVALTGGISAVTSAVVPPLLGGNRTETPVSQVVDEPSYAAFELPLDGQSVKRKVRIRGVASLDGDEALFVCVITLDGQRVFPTSDQPLMIGGSGRFDLITYVGSSEDPRGTAYRIVAVTATPAAAAILTRGADGVGVSRLPSGVRELASKIVYRR